MEHAETLILIGIAAFLLPFAAERLRVPAVVVEILFGILVGPAVLGWVHDSEVISFLAEFGLLLLMFLSGFEIDFGRLETQGPGRLVTGGVIFALTLLLAYLSSGILGQGSFLMFLLATTSVGLVVPTLRAVHRSSSPLGQAILISALFADFLTMLGVTILAMVSQHGATWKLLNLPILMLIILVVLLALRRFAWWYPEKFQRLFESDDPEEMGIRTCLALMFLFTGLSYWLDVEAILGAFLAGTVFALVFRHRDHLEQKVKGFAYGFFIPIFFINVGAQFDLQVLGRANVLLGAGALLVAALLVKLLPAQILLFRRFTIRESLAAGTLLSARLSLVIAVAALGVQLGFLDRVLQSQVILLAIVTSTVCPALFRMILIGGKAEPRTETA